MIATKTSRKKTRETANEHKDVLTLAETAEYLRISDNEVIRLIQEQNLPGRFLGAEWRFLKSAVQDWLKSPPLVGTKEGIWALVGTWKDDPYLDEMLKEIYRKRGRPMTEEA